MSSRQTRYNVAELLLVGFVFHVFFIGSVFDCYFTSPVVHGMKSFSVAKPEAKRLVLIIGDGLRADLLFEKNGFLDVPAGPDVVAPYLRSIVETKGAFGVSHTRVPTESRPGHVAIIGGMYEDVSAVTKGWKTNPVDFDSVFNQSETTFAFGSPDILPMFARGAIPGKVQTWTYNEEDEDFTKDATALDVWVLDHLRSLLQNATKDAILDAQLRSDKVIFFLHLLGLDTTGHSYRPHSPEYMNNIRVVDDIVRQTELLLAEFYRDQETSFIFTADHGMSVIGNHGDGDPDNTRTPLIAWGKGIRGPLPDSSESSHDSYSSPWELNNLLRRDVEQADLAPLMASLVGIPWPVNSVGVLPDVDPSRPGYLSSPDENLAAAALVNAKVILEHYRVKHNMKRAHAVFYQPFQRLSDDPDDETPGSQKISQIETHILSKNWDLARLEAHDLIQDTLAGLHYLQTYQRTLIRGIVISAYIGWMAYASLFVFRPQDNTGGSYLSSVTIIAAAGIVASFWGLFTVERMPWTYYVYVTFPAYFWPQFFAQAARPIIAVLKYGVSVREAGRCIWRGTLTLFALFAMVLGYTHRTIWSLGFLIIGFAWPLMSWPEDTFKIAPGTALAWIVSCLSMAVFPLLSVHKTESLPMILSGGALMFSLGMVYAISLYREAGGRRSSELRLILFQLSLIVATVVITANSITSLQSKLGLPKLNQLSGWIVFAIASLLPFVSPVRHKTILSRAVTFFLGLAPCFIMLSISVEGLFYVAYSLTLYAWLEVETLLRRGLKDSPESLDLKQYRFQPDDIRIVLLFLFFVQVGFFGTGNVASISSFYLSPVYRLIPVFNPFFMAALLIFKIIAPYIILSVTFVALNHSLRLPPLSLFLVALMLTDVMTLTFFFRVLDTGSWLEIGQTISFFCITSLLQVWSGGICTAGGYLMGDVLDLRQAKKSHID